ncbi:hypothetical protein OG946_03120 [Streptomyces sp. NBC_01808]|uniref:hypothetical protein n=1 Tax=Streptomyces sp. NBC_01808 TaxID=2975947 RepID=UPI002DD99DA2|nr:hypothetical protein [Streptomyces sp. NBC_01808]WSA36456.1 hypothetical protein OG946_03120 [Streptomyces sp. NBC_01808]
MSGSGGTSPYAWLPRGAREWSPPYGGLPGTWPRFTAAYALLVLLRITGEVPVPWLLGAAAVVGAASVAGYSLRRRGFRPRGGSWVVAGPDAASLVVPGGAAWAAVRTTVAGGGRVLGGAEAAAALRGAAALLRAADRDAALLTAVVSGPERDGGAQYVVYDEASAFVLRAGGPGASRAGRPGGKPDRGTGARQRALLADVAGELGAEVPPGDGSGGTGGVNGAGSPGGVSGAGGPGDVPDELTPAGRAAASLAATAAAAAGTPLPGTDPDVRPLPWPPHRAAAATADSALRLLTFAVPVALWLAWLAGAWS